MPAASLPTTRASTVFDIPLGTVVRAADTGTLYVFIGWRPNTVGHEAFFGRAFTGTEPPASVRGPIWTYNCAYADTLLQKFPELAAYVRAGT